MAVCPGGLDPWSQPARPRGARRPGREGREDRAKFPAVVDARRPGRGWEKPGRRLDIVITVGTAPEHAHVATWRFLAVLSGHVIPELVLALLSHHAPPGRALDVAIIAVSR